MIFNVYIGIFAIEKGLSDQFDRLATSIASSGLFFAPLMLGWMQGRTLRRSVRLGFGMSALCFLGATLFSPWPGVSVVLLLIGAFYLILLDMCGVLAFLFSVKPSERSEMSAMFSTFRDLANIITPAVVWLVLLIAPLSAVFAAGARLSTAVRVCDLDAEL